MSGPAAYEITADIYDAAVRKLQTVPRDQWPTPADYDRVYLGVRVFEMEQSEINKPHTI